MPRLLVNRSSIRFAAALLVWMPLLVVVATIAPADAQEYTEDELGMLEELLQEIEADDENEADSAAIPEEDDDDSTLPPVPQRVERITLDNGARILTQTTPGVSHIAVLMMLRTGDTKDPKDAPGLSRLLDRIVLTASIEPGDPLLTIDELTARYPRGWDAATYPTHLTFGWVTPTGDAADAVRLAADRLTDLTITTDLAEHAIEMLRAETKANYETDVSRIPTNWLIAKTFRHSSGEPRGVNTETLARLPIERLQQEWNSRAHPSNVTLVLCGAVSGSDATRVAVDAIGSISADGPAPPERMTVEAVGGVAREVVVPRLAGHRPHVAISFYAPEMTDQKHPAFLAVAQTFMRQARTMPGANARVSFQYSILLDPRAAYLTPYAWEFPKGPDQAAGFWVTKIQNKKFSRADVKRAYYDLGWLLGEDLRGGIVAEATRTPELLYSIAYATGLREMYGDDSFWSDYRDRFRALSGADLEAIRDELFFSRNTWALFVLKENR